MGYLILILLLMIIFLDLKGIVNINNKILLGIMLIVNPHFLLITYYMLLINKEGIYFWAAGIYFIYTFFRLMFRPLGKKKTVTKRLGIMYGGCRLLMCAFYAQAVQLALYVFSALKYGLSGSWFIILDGIFVIIYIWLLSADGAVRVLFTSAWLSVIKRILCILFIFIPGINLFVMFYMCKTAGLEYEYESYKRETKAVTQTSDFCKTKYPLVLIHGVGFRDLKYFNYWGRIPHELKRLGAEIYYGNQQAWGTIEQNGEDLKNKILEVVKNTGAEKVNIIAHSKGGLDSRYTISCLGMDKYVASLTTVCTPHRGVKMADVLLKICPDWLFRLVCGFTNRFFAKLGDTSPDFARVVNSFTVRESTVFNERVKDCPGIFYQSYASVIKNVFSDYILLIPYMFIRLIDGKNDGLVTVESAKWGEFKGVFKNKHIRGISHGDMIDLKREDYRGFDVTETYVNIVGELKKKGL